MIADILTAVVVVAAIAAVVEFVSRSPIVAAIGRAIVD